LSGGNAKRKILPTVSVTQQKKIPGKISKTAFGGGTKEAGS
jgi:hypothetical protein